MIFDLDDAILKRIVTACGYTSSEIKGDNVAKIISYIQNHCDCLELCMMYD